MSKHTAGPWKFTYTDESGECFIIAKNLGGMVGAALPWPTEIDARDFRRVIANARLIAVSPELLSIVKRFIALPSRAWHPERHAAEEAELMQEAREVVAKAEAE